MATTKKNHWYIMVLSNKGPKFVTKLGEHRTAYWEDEGTPKEFTKDMATDMCIGFAWNGIRAFPVCSPCELPTQPYQYDKGCFEWHDYPTENDINVK